jgi:LmbE family N-acetylglucosaminyl deacetylase
MPEYIEQPKIAVLVAHPDDETLWCGGTLLAEAASEKFVGTLCRASDADRAPKFERALQRLGATGKMADLDDGPEQLPLARSVVRAALRSLLADQTFDLVITHSPRGEYTRHLRHEEVAAAVLELWNEGELPATQLWLFAYEDGNKSHLPRAIANADRAQDLSDDIWSQKSAIITDVYGFAKDSWEARVTPRREAFWRLTERNDALTRLNPIAR